MSQLLDTSGMHVWLVLWKAYRAMESVDKQSIADLGIGGISDFALLEVLHHKGAMPVNQIGRKIGLTSGSITAAVDRAERKGLVERFADGSDRRVVRIALTEKGRELIAASLTRHAAVLEQAVSVLDPNERKSLVSLLKKLGFHAERLDWAHGTTHKS